MRERLESVIGEIQGNQKRGQDGGRELRMVAENKDGDRE